MRALLGELDEAIDARATDQVDALDRTISALRHQREIIGKLPTWPWSAGTIRGFGSALLLPMILFLIQRYSGRRSVAEVSANRERPGESGDRWARTRQAGSTS